VGEPGGPAAGAKQQTEWKCCSSVHERQHRPSANGASGGCEHQPHSKLMRLPPHLHPPPSPVVPVLQALIREVVSIAGVGVSTTWQGGGAAWQQGSKAVYVPSAADAVTTCKHTMHAMQS
jgi:hypothetical protein